MSEEAADRPTEEVGVEQSVAQSMHEDAADAVSESASSEASIDSQSRGPVSTDEQKHCFWLTDRDQQVLAAGCLLLVVLLIFRAWQLNDVDRSDIIVRDVPGIGYRIDINAASWPELTQLEGVGPALAQRITEDRDANGPFSSIDDLQRVPGIGPKTVEKNRQWMKVVPKSVTD